jgi:hypothetical protein
MAMAKARPDPEPTNNRRGSVNQPTNQPTNRLNRSTLPHPNQPTYKNTHTPTYPTEKLALVAPKIKLEASGEGAEEKQKRLETLPFLLKGHLLELAAACRSGDAAEQLEEMEVRGGGVVGSGGR